MQAGIGPVSSWCFRNPLVAIWAVSQWSIETGVRSSLSKIGPKNQSSVSKIGVPYQKIGLAKSVFGIKNRCSLSKTRVSTGGVETCLLGCQFLNGLSKQRWQAGCWLHQCVLRNTLAGSFRWFICPGMTLYVYIIFNQVNHMSVQTVLLLLLLLNFIHHLLIFLYPPPPSYLRLSLPYAHMMHIYIQCICMCIYIHMCSAAELYTHVCSASILNKHRGLCYNLSLMRLSMDRV